YSATNTYLPGYCPNIARPMGAHPMDTTTGATSATTTPTVYGFPTIIAGDGYTYVPYTYQTVTSVSQSSITWIGCLNGYGSSSYTTETVVHLMVKRTGTDGSSSEIDLQ